MESVDLVNDLIKTDIMVFIQLTKTNGKKVIINTANISYVEEVHQKEISISFINSEDYVRIPVSVKDFTQMLDVCSGDSRSVWVF